LDVFLQILDAARVTNFNGSTLDFSRCYVVFTSNLGGSDVLDVVHSGFATMERHVLATARQHFRPELYARINEKLVFKKLDYEIQLRIARKFLDAEISFLKSKGCRLKVSERVFPFLVREGFHPKLGARPLRDAVERLIGDAVAADLLEGGSGSGQLDVAAEGDCLNLIGSTSAGIP
jgi:ATP-dependent Clp protease ATP-binding subunit ClpB